MKRLSAITLAVCIISGFVFGDITTTGDVEPTDPATWDSQTTAYVGKTANGTMMVDGGSWVSSDTSYVGYSSGSNGNVNIDGEDSGWGIYHSLTIGSEGSGMLGVTNGAGVGCGDGVMIGLSGAAIVNGAGSSLHGEGLYVDGTLDVTNGGEVGGMFSTIGSTGTVTVDGVGSTWNTSFDLTVNGTLNITNGGEVSNVVETRIGGDGNVTVDGAGSTWNIRGIGLFVDGTLNITNGGEIKDNGFGMADGTKISPDGTINFDDGILTTNTIFTGLDNLYGSGTINTKGLLSDLNLVFDSPDDLNQTLIINKHAGQNITVNLEVCNLGTLGAGFNDTASMSISKGVTVESFDGMIGYESGSNGCVTVDGSGSTWVCGDLYIGWNGAGTLEISNGGLVMVYNARLFIDRDGDGDSFVNMSNGGMLALSGHADLSLQTFLDEIRGTDAIRFWDEDTLGWEDITSAMYSEDYTLTYIDDICDDLYGYTVLTVTAVPEPATLLLFSLAGLMLRKQQ